MSNYSVLMHAQPRKHTPNKPNDDDNWQHAGYYSPNLGNKYVFNTAMLETSDPRLRKVDEAIFDFFALNNKRDHVSAVINIPKTPDFTQADIAKLVKEKLVKWDTRKAASIPDSEVNKAVNFIFREIKTASQLLARDSSSAYDFGASERNKKMHHSAIQESSEDLDIIDVSDTLQHAQHEGYYSPNNTANKATPYIFEKIVKSSSGNQIGARFKGQGDRQWVEIFVPTVDFTPNMQNFIALFNAEKGNVKIREEEMRKAARLLTNFFNSPSLPGNEKMTTYVRKPKSLKHALFTEVYDMDDYLEHHGILGMKWGVRRYQNADGSLTDAGRKHYGVSGSSVSDIKNRKGIQKRLNDVDTALARNRRHLYDSLRKNAEYAMKSKGTNSLKKHFKYESKAIEENFKSMEYAANMEKGKKEIDALLKEAVKQGYTVKQIETTRDVSEGKDILMSMLADGAIIGAAIVTHIPVVPIFFGEQAKGTGYKVKETKEGEKPKVLDKKENPMAVKSIHESTQKGMQEYYKKLDSEEMDKAAHKEASRYGLDQADNYKVFRDALIGDEEAQRIVDEWKRNR